MRESRRLNSLPNWAASRCGVSYVTAQTAPSIRGADVHNVVHLEEQRFFFLSFFLFSLLSFFVCFFVCPFFWYQEDEKGKQGENYYHRPSTYAHPAPHSSPFLDLRLMGKFLAALAILTTFPLSMRLRHALIPVVHHRVFLSCHPSQYRVYIAPPLDIESEISTYMAVTD